MMKFRTLLLVLICVGASRAFVQLGEWRDSLPVLEASMERVVSDIRLPLVPGPMCKLESDEFQDNVTGFVASQSHDLSQVVSANDGHH